MPSPLRNLGQMLGNIAAGIFADPHNPPKRLQDPPPPPPPHFPPAPPAPHFTPPQPPPASPPPAPQVINTRVQTATIDTPQGPVHLRRTVIDEVVPPPPPPSSSHGP